MQQILGQTSDINIQCLLNQINVVSVSLYSLSFTSSSYELRHKQLHNDLHPGGCSLRMHDATVAGKIKPAPSMRIPREGDLPWVNGETGFSESMYRPVADALKLNSSSSFTWCECNKDDSHTTCKHYHKL